MGAAALQLPSRGPHGRPKGVPTHFLGCRQGAHDVVSDDRVAYPRLCLHGCQRLLTLGKSFKALTAIHVC